MADAFNTGDLRDEDTAKQFYEERFQDGYMDDWPHAKKQRVAELLRVSGLSSTGIALDYGCGDGVFTEVIRRALPGWEVWGMDISDLAVQNAAARFPECRFQNLRDFESSEQEFGLLFTHHVLEHVSDLDATIALMASKMREESAMIHILPCGNVGSLEQEICELRTDGTDPNLGGRRFYEDIGHLRRLTSDELADHLGRFGFDLAKGSFAFQYWGAIDYFTDQEPHIVKDLVDLRPARNDEARSRLRRLVAPMRRVAACRDLVRRYNSWRGRRTLRGRLRRAAYLPAYAVCKAVDRYVTRQAKAEWDRRQDDPAGSEMYLRFERKSGASSDATPRSTE